MIFVFIFVCVAITVACNYIVKKNKEKQRQLLEAAELLQRVPDDLMRAMKANEERHTNDQQQLEAFGAKFDAPTATGEIRSHEEMYQERITCANGHHFLLIDLLGGGQGGCCPMCKTSAFSFDDTNARRYFYCPSTTVGVMRVHERILKAQGDTFTKDDMEPYIHWFRDETDDCPLCRWSEEQGAEVARHPLTNIALNVEKLKTRQGMAQ